MNAFSSRAVLRRKIALLAVKPFSWTVNDLLITQSPLQHMKGNPMQKMDPLEKGISILLEAFCKTVPEKPMKLSFVETACNYTVEAG